jgi:hypothetical protein
MAAEAREPVYDRQEQLETVRSGLLDGENVLAVYDGKGGGTGFIGLTDRRVILQDNSFVGKRTALTSVPYSRIAAVSFVSDKSMFGKLASSGSIAIAVAAHTYEMEFRGVDKAKHCHDVILFFITSG